MTSEKTLLLRHAEILVTMDDERREIADGAVLITGNKIAQIGTTAELPPTADRVIDLTGHILLPGMVNTHHHMYQSLTRAVPAAQNGDLFQWLRTLYPIWGRLTPEMIAVSTQTAMAELILSGCTTSSDHLYIYPNGCRLDDAINAAQTIGMRFHACRGSMSVGESAGGLPPDDLVERESDIIKDSQRLIETYHDARQGSMMRVALAPCSPFSVSENLMREQAKMARHYGVGLHTHLAETAGDVAYSRAKFSCTPGEYAEKLGWVGPDVWHAHCVCLDEAAINLFAKTKTGIAHCPSSNMRLASGMAPITAMQRAGVKIGLGVDGSASNDGGHMMLEARLAMLMARLRESDAAAMTARAAIALATRGGAAVLGREDIGRIAVGLAADVVAFPLTDLAFAGGLHDPVAALVFCAPTRVGFVVINGRVLVEQGAFVRLDLAALVTQHNILARRLVAG